MKKILAILLILCCALPAAAKKRQNEEIITPLTQLEKRQFQTKTYSAGDTVIAMKAILNVLQDEGFIVYNVNSLLGYIYGVKDFDISDPNVDISKEFGVTKSRLNYNGVKVATLEMSANVTQYGDNSRVRVNFKRKLLNEYGNAQMIDDIDDVQYYDEFYKKVDLAIALQKQIQQKLQISAPIKIKQTLPKPRPVIKKPEPVIPVKYAEPDELRTDEGQSNVMQENVILPEQAGNVSESGQVSDSAKNPEPAEQEKINAEEETAMPKAEENGAEKDKKQVKEALKQAKKDAKLAKKEAKQAAKEARRAEKKAQKEAKRQAKDKQSQE